VAEAFVAGLRAGKAITLPGALHEVMQERDDLRDRFWAAFDAFVPGSRDLAIAG
jgi:lysophospholipase